MHEVAIYVDKKMSEIHRKYDKLSTSMVAVLAAVNITDELLKERRKSTAKPKKEPADQEQTKAEQKPEKISRFSRT